MRQLDEFYPFVLPYAQNVPDPTADLHIRQAARQFCRSTRCWRETDEFKVTGHEIEVLCVPPYADLVDIEQARFDGLCLQRAPFKDVSGETNYGDIPSYITQASINTISLIPRGSGGKLWISMFLMPTIDAEAVPDFLLTQWGQEIGWGALASILRLPWQPFTSPEMAVYFEIKFQEAKSRFFGANIRGQQRAPARARARWL